MLIYLIILFILLISINIKIVNKNIYLLFMMLFLIVISGFRYNIGKDFTNYNINFINLNPENLTKGKELGFIYFNYFIKYKINGNFQLVILITAILNGFFIYKALKKEPNFFKFSLFLYVTLGFYIQSFNIMRQAAAMSIGLYAFTFIEGKKLIKYLFCILIGMFFHVSVITILPLYFVANLKFSKKNYVLGIVISFIILKLDIIKTVVLFFLQLIGSRYSEFILNGKDDPNSGTGIIRMLLIGIVFITIFYKERFSKKLYMYFNIAYIFILFDIMFFKFMLGARSILYYKMAMLIFLPSTINTIFKNKTYRRIYRLVLILIFSAVYIKFLLTSTMIVPYENNFKLF